MAHGPKSVDPSTPAGGARQRSEGGEWLIVTSKSGAVVDGHWQFRRVQADKLAVWDIKQSSP